MSYSDPLDYWLNESPVDWFEFLLNQIREIDSLQEDPFFFLNSPAADAISRYEARIWYVHFSYYGNALHDEPIETVTTWDSSLRSGIAPISPDNL